MKSEHRHELKTNELVEWLSNLPGWARRNRNTIIYLSVLVIVVVGLYVWKYYSENVIKVGQQQRLTQMILGIKQAEGAVLQARRQGQDLSYRLLDPADKLQTFARSTEDDEMAALALLKRGQALYIELIYRVGSVSDSDKQAALSRAVESYRRAIERSPEDPTLTGLARFGIGLCKLEIGDFEKARKHFTQITENPEMKHTTAYRMAKLRLATMDDSARKITFSSAPVRRPQEPVGPQRGAGEESLQLDFPGANAPQTEGDVPDSVTVEP